MSLNGETPAYRLRRRWKIISCRRFQRLLRWRDAWRHIDYMTEMIESEFDVVIYNYEISAGKIVRVGAKVF